MSAFTENIAIRPDIKTNTWVVDRDLEYHIGHEESEEKVIVPAWFVFDWASVPSIFWWFIQKVEPRTLSAAAVHDYLYTKWRAYSRKCTDYIFYESLLVCWVPKFKAYIMWLWVRAGWRLYRDNII